MCNILASSAIGGVFAVVFSLAAQAFPAPPYQPGSGERVETLIAQGCGPGMHRGTLGGCRRNAVIVAPRAPRSGRATGLSTGISSRSGRGVPTKLNCGKRLKVARVALPLGPVSAKRGLGRGIDSLMWPNYLIACEPLV
jgi:hypothetical protein